MFTTVRNIMVDVTQHFLYKDYIFRTKRGKIFTAWAPNVVAAHKMVKSSLHPEDKITQIEKLK